MIYNYHNNLMPYYYFKMTRNIYISLKIFLVVNFNLMPGITLLSLSLFSLSLSFSVKVSSTDCIYLPHSLTHPLPPSLTHPPIHKHCIVSYSAETYLACIISLKLVRVNPKPLTCAGDAFSLFAISWMTGSSMTTGSLSFSLVRRPGLPNGEYASNTIPAGYRFNRNHILYIMYHLR